MNLANVRSLAGLGALVVAVLAACEGKTTKPTPEQPAIAVAVGSSSVSVTAGTNGTVGVTLTRSGGFTGAVSVSAAGAPSGVTINPITLATGQTSGSLTIATTAAAPVGTSTITLSASGTGVATKTATFTLNVTAPPGFTLTLPKATTRNGVSAVMMAANVNAREEDMTGRTKTEKDAIESIRLLLAAGADVNGAETQGRTALHGAAQWGMTEVVKFLQAQGANMNAPDRRGYTPLDYALGLAGGFGFDGKAGVTHDATAKAIRELGGKDGAPTGLALPERRANGAQDDPN